MNTIKHFIIAIVPLLMYFGAKAQTGIIKGHIYDLQTYQPLAGVLIQPDDETGKTVSDERGYFEINTTRPEGSLRLSVPGYKARVVHYVNDRELNIQMEPDAHLLNEVRVAAYSGNKTNKETAGAIALLNGADIQQGNSISMQAALNSIPGVRMDQSTLSDSRISIRGNGVRSPWGIRNIKIYINDIPLTEADGTTRIEGLDVNDLGQAEIIKGPASSIYGGGTGGVIRFRLGRAPYQEQSFEAAALAGSFGLSRLAVTYRNGGNKINSYVSYGRQQYNGYREHSNDKRTFITANFQLFPSDKRLITLLVNRTTQHAQIPGALTQEEVNENPRQASEANLDKHAGRSENWTRIGLGQRYRFNDKLSNRTSVFTYFYDLDHPLPFAYIHNYYQSYGGRTQFDYDAGFSALPTKFTIGGEFSQANSKGTQYANDHGKEGTISGNTDYKDVSFSLFLQSETSIGKTTALTLGISYNGLSYDVKDYLHEDRSGIKRFKPQASPRAALSHNFGKALSLHGSISSGFSPPAGTEIQDVDGSINRQLQAQRAINYEIDAKGNLFRSRVAYDLALFKMDMKGELIAQSVQQGITVYHNSGRTTHTGSELLLSYRIIKEEDHKNITQLRPYLAVTYAHFRFEDYQILDAGNNIIANYDGNKLTGIAPWVISGGIHIEAQAGFYGNASCFYSGPLPLNDLNTVYNPAYSVFNAKIGYRKNLNKHFALNLYSGMDNISNTRYSSFTSLNAVGYGGNEPAYFDPAPERSMYAGIDIKYLF